MKILVKLLLLFVVASCAMTFISSCSDENDCSMDGRPMAYCSFYKMDRLNNVAVKDTLDSLTITAIGTDSIILNNEKKVQKIMLPLRYSKDSTVFILHYDYKRNPQWRDTLSIKHQNTTKFQSIECGYLIEQYIEKATFKANTTLFDKLDSLHIKNHEANTDEIQNIQLFFTPIL